MLEIDLGFWLRSKTSKTQDFRSCTDYAESEFCIIRLSDGWSLKRAYNFCSRRYFRNPNGGKLDLGVGNLLLKFQDDPTVN